MKYLLVSPTILQGFQEAKDVVEKHDSFQFIPLFKTLEKLL